MGPYVVATVSKQRVVLWPHRSPHCWASSVWSHRVTKAVLKSQIRLCCCNLSDITNNFQCLPVQMLHQVLLITFICVPVIHIKYIPKSLLFSQLEEERELNECMTPGSLTHWIEHVWNSCLFSRRDGFHFYDQNHITYCYVSSAWPTGVQTLGVVCCSRQRAFDNWGRISTMQLLVSVLFVSWYVNGWVRIRKQSFFNTMLRSSTSAFTCGIYIDITHINMLTICTSTRPLSCWFAGPPYGSHIEWEGIERGIITVQSCYDVLGK